MTASGSQLPRKDIVALRLRVNGEPLSLEHFSYGFQLSGPLAPFLLVAICHQIVKLMSLSAPKYVINLKSR